LPVDKHSPALLVVDDSSTIRKMIMTALRPLNPTFREASSGLEALEQLSLNQYDAVTLDLNMPDMHGLEFLNFLRSHSMFKDIPVVVITTRIDDEMRQSVIRAGANLYITKPFSPHELLEAVKMVMEKSNGP
jgi:two-component system, chemotaxis family, chemotaxis protein CheY